MNANATLRSTIETEAICLGFSHFGITKALPHPSMGVFQDWVRKGNHADMAYLSREDALAKRRDPNLVLEGCQSIICLAFPYKPPKAELLETRPGAGRISAYALTRDYHDILREKLSELETFITEYTSEDLHMKSYVDTGPILERAYAVSAGIGTIGKNGNLMIQGAGSYFFLAEILTDLELPTDKPLSHDLCKSCRRCIKACPTQCIQPDRTIDANRCISYLTIENKGEIQDDLKPEIGDWLFGCDVCQMVCPHNARALEGETLLGEPLLPEFIDLMTLFTYDEDTFRKQFAQTPLVRAKRTGVLRNAAVVLGNQRYTKAFPVLEQALSQETDPSVLDACRWAVAQINNNKTI